MRKTNYVEFCGRVVWTDCQYACLQIDAATQLIVWVCGDRIVREGETISGCGTIERSSEYGNIIFGKID